MKVQADNSVGAVLQKITSQPEFRPVTLQITIESQKEYQLLLDILRSREDIAPCLETYNVLTREEANFLEDLLINIYDEF